MKAFHAKRLLKLANHLYTEPSNFDFSFIGRETECGTMGCALGQCPSLFPRYCKFERYDKVGNFMVVGIREYKAFADRAFSEEFFGLIREEANDVFFNIDTFYDNTYGCHNYQVTANMVGDKIVRLLDKQGFKVLKKVVACLG